MDTVTTLFDQLLVRVFTALSDWTSTFAPKVFLAALILLLGWVFSVVLGKTVSKVLRALGFDVLSERTGIVRFLERGGIHQRPSVLMGRGVYWLIMFSALSLAFDTLEFRPAVELLERVVLFIPKILLALILLALGLFLSHFLQEFVTRSARIAELPFAQALGYLARYAIITIASLMALEQLSLLSPLVLQLVAFVLLVTLLVILVGGREIISSILASRMLCQEFAPGDCIEFDDLAGEILAIDLLTTKILADDQEVVVPNTELTKKIIRKTRRPQPVTEHHRNTC
ncbi:MAG: hypothetical protein D6704_12225 [Nitrospirae bacterium]|nr:MAG: hypothetical protein D6704_12225 [Nitrospirota bacterium]